MVPLGRIENSYETITMKKHFKIKSSRVKSILTSIKKGGFKAP